MENNLQVYQDFFLNNSEEKPPSQAAFFTKTQYTKLKKYFYKAT